MTDCLWTFLTPAPLRPALPLPDRVDVAIIGAGYTGLAAARALAGAGTRVAVLEREQVGFGASSRNGGMVLPGYKPDLPVLIRRYGRGLARQLFRDSLEAVDFIERLVQEEGIACDWRRAGHLTAAARPRCMRDLDNIRRLMLREFDYRTELFSRAELRSELGSSHYHGGLLDPFAGAVQPAAWLQGLAGSAERAGATLHEGVEVTALEEQAGGVVVRHRLGELHASQVLVATNGYTGTWHPWLARRVVPVGSFIIATEPLDPEQLARLIPRDRMVSDTRNLLYYFRRSPDGRLVFGGRAAFVPAAVERSRELLTRGLTTVFPELHGVRVTHAWGGTLGFTLDQLPHVGRVGHTCFVAGYGGHGVAMATWLGDRVARAMLGAGPWPAIAGTPFRPVPLYRGRPWFLPLAGAYYQLKDWLM